MLAINGVNPDGRGCVVAAPLAEERRLTAKRRNVLTKLTCHLAAAHRLRRLQATGEALTAAPEAILSSDGTVRHAESGATSREALTRLQQSALAIASARGDLRLRDPEQAVDEWKGLIAARRTLLEVCEMDGRKYLVARQNRPESVRPNSAHGEGA